MTIDPHIAGMLAQVNGMGHPDLSDLPLPVLRAMMRQNALAMEAPPPAGVDCFAITLEGAAGPLDARLYQPAGTNLGPTLLWFHGGGFVAGDLDGYDPFCRRLAALSGLRVLAATYRLAPEHPFPAAHEDALAILSNLLRDGAAHGIDPSRLIVGGDSAGANLAAASLLDLVPGLPRPRALLLFYPAVAFGPDNAGREQLGDGYLLTRPTMRLFTELYLPHAKNRVDARVNLLLREGLTGCPPTLLLTAGYDPLGAEGVELARRLAVSGVTVEHRHQSGLIHAFIHMTGITPAVDIVLHQVADWLRRC